MAEKKSASIKLPKTLAGCADLYAMLRDSRLSKQREANETKAEEGIVREHLIANLPKSQASGVSGKIAQVTVESAPEPTVVDLKKFLQYVLKSGSFDLITTSSLIKSDAIKERWADKVKIPGVGSHNVVKLRVHMLKKRGTEPPKGTKEVASKKPVRKPA